METATLPGSTELDVDQVQWPLVCFGLTLATLATVLLELSLTRIFSAVFDYHFAFLAVSIALFGLGAGGLYSCALPRRPLTTLFRGLGLVALAAAASTVFALIWVLSRPAAPMGLTAVAIYGLASLPFFFEGIIIATVIVEAVNRIERAYFWDLAGAAAGCLLVVPLLDLLGGPGTVLAVAIVSTTGAAIWFSLAGASMQRILAVVATFGLVTLAVANAKRHWIDVNQPEGNPRCQELFAKWNSYSRVAVIEDEAKRTYWLQIDSGMYPLASWDPHQLTPEQRSALMDHGAAIPYVLIRRPRVLILGAKGGWDVLRALAAGSEHVTAVEANPIIAHTVMQRRFVHQTRSLYLRPEVEVVVGDPRSFLRRSPEQFDVIQTSSWASSGSQLGSLALRENALYTLEALRDYWNHLRAGGLVALTYPASLSPWESRRLMGMAAQVLRENSTANPESHFVVLRERTAVSGGTEAIVDTFLLSKVPFSAEALAKVTEHCHRAGLQVLWPAESPRSGPASLRLSPHFDGPSEPVELEPSTDNRPYFFQGFASKPSASPRHTTGVARPHSVLALSHLLAITLAITVGVFWFPTIAQSWRRPLEKRVYWWLAYFLSIGAGYLLVQVSLVQHCIVLLDRPTHALTVVLFSMLVSSALGSYFSRRLLRDSPGALPGATGVAALLIAAVALVLPSLMSGGLSWPLWIRMGALVVLISPIGFLLGLPFPVGMRRLAQLHPEALRWAWATNSAASVTGSVMAAALAMHLGFREALLTGALVYTLALLCVSGAQGTPTGERSRSLGARSTVVV